MNSNTKRVTLDDLKLSGIPASLQGRLDVDSSALGYPQIGISHDGYFITEPYFDIGLIDAIQPSEYGLTTEEADFIVATNRELTAQHTTT